MLKYTNRAGVAVKAARYLAKNADELVAETARSSELTESSSGDGILPTVQASEKPRDIKYSSKTVEINPHVLYRCLKAVELSLIAENEEPLAHLKEKLFSKLNSQEQQSLIQDIAYLKKNISLDKEAAALLGCYYDRLLALIQQCHLGTSREKIIPKSN